MSHSLSKLLLLYAQQFEDQHAPQNMTIALREAADTITRFTAQNDFLANDRDGYIQLLTDQNNRLTAEVEQNATDLEEYRRDVERLRSVTVLQETLIRKSEAENEKLRAGLWDIHAYCNNWDWFIWMWPMRHIKRIARAALSGDKHE